MPEPSTLALFATAGIAMLAFPGPSVLYIITRSVDQGRRAGLVSILRRRLDRAGGGMLGGLGAAAALAGDTRR